MSVCDSDEKLCRRWSWWSEAGVTGATGSSGALDEPALIAAFSIRAKGGLIPHVRQGGIGNASEAMDGSKLDGTGFVKVQMGQTQLAGLATGVTLDTVLGLKGLEDREPGEDEDCCKRCTPGDKGELWRTDPGAFLRGLG